MSHQHWCEVTGHEWEREGTRTTWSTCWRWLRAATYSSQSASMSGERPELNVLVGGVLRAGGDPAADSDPHTRNI